MTFRILHLWDTTANRTRMPGAAAAVAGLVLLSASAAAQTGPVAAYGLNETSGTTAADASGSGLDGTLKGASWNLTGKHGGALSFNGSSSYVDLGNPSALQFTGSMTVSAWVYPTAHPGDDGQIVAKSDGGGWQFKTSPDTGVRTFGFAVTGGSGLVQRYSQSVYSLYKWYHVAGVYNASAKTLDIYVNGVLDNGVLNGSVPSAQVNSSVNVNIGRRTGGYLFAGLIDEVRIYNRALTAAQVQADMNAPVGNPVLPPSSACDLNSDQTVNGADVQLAIDMSLNRVSPCTANIAGAGVCNVVVVQRVINAVNDGQQTCLVGTSPVPHSVTLNWIASTSPNVVGYNIYRGTTRGGPYSLLTAQVTGTTYKDTAVQAGQTFYYVATAVDSNSMESVYSNEATAVIPTP